MSSLLRPVVASLVLGSAVFVGTPALATNFVAAELSQDTALLSQFNLTTLNNYTDSGSSTAAATVQGRALVGGNATFSTSSAVCTTNCTGNSSTAIDGTGTSFGALTVFGYLTAPGGTSAAVTANAGDVNVKGTSTGNIALGTTSGGGGKFDVMGTASGTNVVNAGAIRTTQSSFSGGSYNTPDGVNFTAGTTPQVSQTVATVFPFTTAYQTNVKNLAQGIANLPGTPGVTTQNLPSSSNLFFTAANDYTAGGKKYGVVTTTLANLASETGTFQGINNGTNDATFVIVYGDGANYLLPNLNSTSESKVIFDFVDATTLRFAGNWSGTILAPLATITQQGGSFNGSVVVANMNQTQELYDTGLFNGDLSGLAGLSTSARVPEPASMGLLGLGIVAAGWARRRVRKQPITID